jgi:hypothetical protein
MIPRLSGVAFLMTQQNGGLRRAAHNSVRLHLACQTTLGLGISYGCKEKPSQKRDGFAPL